MTTACDLCGCLLPGKPEPCLVCSRAGCAGCLTNGVCELCFDIEQERWG
jgi:hypothetical protein